MRYFIYARKSMEDASKQIQSIPSQLEWAERMRVNLGLEIIDVFSDTGSGAKPGREGFGALMAAIAAQEEPVGVLCWKVNRLARNALDAGAIQYALTHGNIDHILTSDRRFNKGDNLLIMGLEFANATQYSLDLSRDIRRGMDRKVERGWMPCMAQLGYRNDPGGLEGDRRIFPDEAAWSKVRRLWDLLLTGEYSVPQLRNIANNELQLRTRYGAELSLSVVHKIFRNPFYTGWFKWKGQRVHGRHKPMISLAELDRAGSIITGKRARQQKLRPLWNGLLRCGECGCMITSEPPKVKVQKNGNRHVYHYMRCTKRNRNIRCGQPYLRQSELERQMEELLASIQPPREFADWVLEKLQRT